MIISIELTRGYVALILKDDLEWIETWKWYASGSVRIYAARKDYLSQKLIYMHHQILGVMPWSLNGLEIDHIDGNSLNNCKNNLRLVTHEENMRNTVRHKNRRGYSFNIRTGKWNCYIDNPGEPRKYLGHVNSEDEAKLRVKLARDEHAI